MTGAMPLGSGIDPIDLIHTPTQALSQQSRSSHVPEATSRYSHFQLQRNGKKQDVFTVSDVSDLAIIPGQCFDHQLGSIRPATASSAPLRSCQDAYRKSLRIGYSSRESGRQTKQRLRSTLSRKNYRMQLFQRAYHMEWSHVSAVRTTSHELRSCSSVFSLSGICQKLPLQINDCDIVRRWKYC